MFAWSAFDLHQFIFGALVDCRPAPFLARSPISFAGMDVPDSLGVVPAWQRARLLPGGSLSDADSDGRGGRRALDCLSAAAVAPQRGGRVLYGTRCVWSIHLCTGFAVGV